MRAVIGRFDLKVIEMNIIVVIREKSHFYVRSMDASNGLDSALILGDTKRMSMVLRVTQVFHVPFVEKSS